MQTDALGAVADAGYLYGFLDTPQPTLPEPIQSTTELLQAFTALT
jgi:hypothetical protein